MITKFLEFLYEYTSYSVPHATVGFKYSEPTNKFTIYLDMIYDGDNENKIKSILSKYNISYENMNFKDEMYKDSEDNNVLIQKIEFSFFAYNDLEADSIIKTILGDFVNNDINFNPQSIIVKPLLRLPSHHNVRLADPGQPPSDSINSRRPVGFNT
jgi:hypothetical protein